MTRHGRRSLLTLTPMLFVFATVSHAQQEATGENPAADAATTDEGLPRATGETSTSEEDSKASPTGAASSLGKSRAAGPTVLDIRVRGNAKVESDAIATILNTKKGEPLQLKVMREDIRRLYELGYFSDIRVFQERKAGGLDLVIQVVEKPAIIAIEFEGLEELTEEDIQEKLETKLYTIVNEATVTSDVRMIERQYAEKGFYLASVNYTLEKDGANEVKLIFQVEEGGEVQVGNVHILGNEYFTDIEILNDGVGFASRPYTRSTAFSDASLYQEDNVKRDLDYLSFKYRDQGFAKVKVAKPNMGLDPDREFVQLTFKVEEGLQYWVDSYDVSGDLLFTKEYLFEKMKLKSGALFRHSHFAHDVEMIVREYGDLGYAYADVDPKVDFDDKTQKVKINYVITKGEKVYFGKMTILGNTKTRDNVVRREFEIADSELYSGTGLENTKKNINRLGFFEEVQIVRERDESIENLMHLKVKVKEKPTGQLQAAVGFTPTASGTRGSQWFGQGRYDEKNQSGLGYQTNLTGKWNGEENYSIEARFSNPRINDSQWNGGITAFYKNERKVLISEVELEETRVGGSVFLGRKIIELIRGQVTYSLQKITRTSEQFLLDRFREDGIASSVILSLSRRDVDNFIDPTDGSEVVLRQKFTGGEILKGDQKYMESSADATYYLPLDFTETYRTYFKLHGLISYIYPMGGHPVPFTERYRLGGFNDLRGFKFNAIGPEFFLLRSPGGQPRSLNKGGDKKLVFQLEYFMPLIPEAGIKALLFGDMGRVYDDDESIAWSGFSRDVGFGFRWITPIAPFRFEWAYPIEEDGSLGEMEIIFYIGY